MTTKGPDGAKRGRRAKPRPRFRPSGEGYVEPAAFRAARALNDDGLEGLLARRVERQWLARGLVLARPVSQR